jgi:ribosomal protein S18 acetylase RimI-like enzyme
MAELDSPHEAVEVVPFARLRQGAMDDVFEAQRKEWLSRLGWDISEIVEFVDSAIRGRSLRGSAVMTAGAVVGFGFFTVEVDRCLIGEIYVRPQSRSAPVNAALVESLIAQIRQTRPRKRVESQSIVFDARGLDEVFLLHGFTRHDRDYLVAPLDAAPPVEHPDVEVRAWEEQDFSDAIEIVYRAYRGTVDAALNVQYRSREGCADLLDALTESAWCGIFQPSLARIAVDRTTRRRCGVAIASAIGRDTAHLGQISVLPEYQNRGVGRAMIAGALTAARTEGYTRATLAVTRANLGAVALYESLGFRPSVAFPVYTRDPAPFKLRP